MGKLHGLCLGLDVCSTLHMDVSLNDLDWCLDQIMPAQPAYLMALPTKIDPMLGYLTTGYQDHVRLRDKFGLRVNDGMWSFFRKLGVINEDGKPAARFGDPLAVFLEYHRRKGDPRSDQEILRQGRRELSEVRKRGVFIVEGHGNNSWDLPDQLQADVRHLYDDAKLSIWAELPPEFVQTIPECIRLSTQSVDRNDYILHPQTGEQLSESSRRQVLTMKQQQQGLIDVQLVISDGLNALSISEDGHLLPFLSRLREGLQKQDLRVAPQHILVQSGRVRAGYRIGELLFGKADRQRTILHVIGERPGTGHRTFSVYMTTADGNLWSTQDAVDHNITKVVSGIAATAFDPSAAADEVNRILKTML